MRLLFSSPLWGRHTDRLNCRSASFDSHEFSHHALESTESTSCKTTILQKTRLRMDSLGKRYLRQRAEGAFPSSSCPAAASFICLMDDRRHEK